MNTAVGTKKTTVTFRSHPNSAADLNYEICAVRGAFRLSAADEDIDDDDAGSFRSGEATCCI